MTTLAPPDPATYRPIIRDRPYASFIDRAFDPATSTRSERKMLRFLYRAFREQLYSSPFSSRAQIASSIMHLDSIKDGL